MQENARSFTSSSPALFLLGQTAQQCARPTTWSHYNLAKHLTRAFDEYLSSQSKPVTCSWMNYKIIALSLREIVFDFDLYQIFTVAMNVKSWLCECP